ncbi:MAG: hypothetical protein H8E38_05230 [SAR324 cluster bacterium]|nr:hypothetical protein [SAR324 cluster bacterium]MBL7034109.1 hypothetical protein [SAR324 cluster bacterium]
MRYFILLSAIGSIFMLASCSISTFGKFQADEGIPSFIKIGETTRKEIINNLGEPLVHRFVVGKETLIYNHERGEFFFLYGTYEGSELIIRFENKVVSEVKIEKTGSGWGVFAPATSNNPGTRRSAR